jgi:hypothetical protein
MVLEPNFGTGRNRPVADSKQATDMSNEESGLPPLVLPFGSMVAGSGGIAGAASVNPAPPHGDTVRIEERFLSIRKAIWAKPMRGFDAASICLQHVSHYSIPGWMTLGRTTSRICRADARLAGSAWWSKRGEGRIEFACRPSSGACAARQAFDCEYSHSKICRAMTR